MRLKIASEHVVQIADILEEYILADVKENSSNFDIVNSLCTFYRKLKNSAVTDNNDDEFAVLEVDGMVRRSVPDMIRNHINDIVKDADTLDLISEITSIYNILKDGNGEIFSSGNNSKNNKKKKNGGGDGNRSSTLDVKDAQYNGENTQNTENNETTDAEEQTDKAEKPEAGGEDSGEEKIEDVENPQWAYDDAQLY